MIISIISSSTNYNNSEF